MNIKRFWINGLVVMILGSILVGCYYYIKSVQTSLWTQNAEQALEITSQGGRAFETYIEIEQERVHGLANKISELESHEESKILNNLNLLGGETSNYTVVDLDHGFMYSNRLEDRFFIGCPVVCWYRVSRSFSSFSKASFVEIFDISGWWKVWFPTLWPSATIRFTRSGLVCK